jgi:mono/diheme cytochrome c family protein
MKKVLFLFAVSAIVACASPQTKTETNPEQVAAEKVVAEKPIDVLDLVEKRCLICHGAGESHDDLLAPPLRGVKNHYLEDYPEREEFVEALVKWNAGPDSNEAIMIGAVERFGVMPALMYPAEEVRAIAEYIYDNDQPKPSWMKKGMKHPHD